MRASRVAFGGDYSGRGQSRKVCLVWEKYTILLELGALFSVFILFPFGP
jgi:hypothetical protein